MTMSGRAPSGAAWRTMFGDLYASPWAHDCLRAGLTFDVDARGETMQGNGGSVRSPKAKLEGKVKDPLDVSTIDIKSKMRILRCIICLL